MIVVATRSLGQLNEGCLHLAAPSGYLTAVYGLMLYQGIGQVASGSDAKENLQSEEDCKDRRTVEGRGRGYYSWDVSD